MSAAVTARVALLRRARRDPRFLRVIDHLDRDELLGIRGPRMFDAHVNLGYTTVLTAPSPATSGTTIACTGGNAFPAAPYNAIVGVAGWTEAQWAAGGEIIRVTANTSSKPSTIVRASEGPNAARSIVAGDVIKQVYSSKNYSDLETKVVGGLVLGRGSDIVAASSIAVTNTVHQISGTTTISNITGSVDGAIVTLVPTGAGVNFTNGGNLDTGGPVILAATGWTITFVWDTSDGNWKVQSIAKKTQIPDILAIVKGTSRVNITSTTEASGTSVLSSGAITFDGSECTIDFFCPRALTPNVTGGIFVCLFEGATEIARLGYLYNGSAVQVQAPLNLSFDITPSAGSHTYSLTAFADSTSGTPFLEAGAGGTGTFAPMKMTVTRLGRF